MKSKLIKLYCLVVFINPIILNGQQVINTDSIETLITLIRNEKSFPGYTMFNKEIIYSDFQYKILLADDKFKNNIDSVDIVNLYGPGGQVISSSYPFINSSVIFSIEKKKCIYLNKINPFDSTIYVKIWNCPEFGIADTLISEIPDINITNYFTNEKINLRQYVSEKGVDKIVFHFWATWCEPCVKELPLLKELQKRGYFIINFCSPQNSEKDKLLEYVSKFDLCGPQFIGGNDIVGDMFNQSGFPNLILFQPNEKYPKYFRGIESVLEYITDLKNKK